MEPDNLPGSRPGGDGSAVPVAGVTLAVGFLLGLVCPVLLPFVTAAALAAAAALALVHRGGRQRRLRLTVMGLGLYLAAVLSLCWWCGKGPVSGLGLVLGLVFLLPLPLVPWLYARSSDEGDHL